MDAAKLIAEGERLDRPCVELRTKGAKEAFAGIWGGKGVLEPEEEPWQHWLTIDGAWLAGLGLPCHGCLGVYTNEDDCRTGKVVQAKGALPRKLNSGIELYARENRSFPPIEAVFEFGSAAVEDWLVSLKWSRDWGGGANFPDAAGHVYDRDTKNAARCMIHRNPSWPCWVGGTCRGLMVIGAC
jgi:hypothetical protein